MPTHATLQNAAFRFVTLCFLIFGYGSLFARNQGEAADVSMIVRNAEVSENAPDSSDGMCDCRFWHISTDIAGWAAAVANVSGELDFARHWSMALSARYSAWNYGRSVRKFRTFEFRPEIRFWPRRAGNGFYVDAHLASIYYNVALDGWDYRIQDRGGAHPSLGGGLGAGYRLNFGGGRWGVDFSIGLGVYNLDYDRFENRRNGPLVDSRRRTFFGVDRLGISLVYNFNPVKR